MIDNKAKARRRFAIGLYAVLCTAAFAFSGDALATARGQLHDVASAETTPADPSARTELVDRWLRIDARHVLTDTRRRRQGLTLIIRHLPITRRTIRQLAIYYYGAPQMSFVLLTANPWLAGFRLDQSFSRYPDVRDHPTIRVPTVRGGRPVGPA